jgi:hypothetical protein
MNVVVYIVCAALGYLAGSFLPPGMWALSVSVLISYHLFLVWLLLTAEHEVGFSMPIVSSILTHVACLVVVVVMILGRM